MTFHPPPCSRRESRAAWATKTNTAMTKHAQTLENTVEIEVWTAAAAAYLAGRAANGYDALHRNEAVELASEAGDQAVLALRERLGQTSDLRAEVEKQRARADKAERNLLDLQRTLSEAFNSGDGSYRP